MPEHSNSLEHTVEIVSNFVSHNTASATDLPSLIQATFAALEGLGKPPMGEVVEEPIRLTPSRIRKSITPEALVSFINGKPYKTLKRHLSTNGLTIEAYKARFGLPKDYPTTAPAYSEQRSALAKALGLGSGGREPKTSAKIKAAHKPS